MYPCRPESDTRCHQELSALPFASFIHWAAETAGLHDVCVGSEGRRGRWGTPTMALHTYSIESRLIMRVKVWAPWLDYESDESDASTTRRLSAAHRWSHLMAPTLEPLSPRTQKGGDRSQKGGPPFPPRRLSRGPASPGSSDAGCLPADFGDSPTQGQTRSGPNRGFHRVKYFC